MKNKFSTILPLLFVCVVACSAKWPQKEAPKSKQYAEWINPDGTIRAKLGNTLTELLFNPQKVECYSIEWQDSIKPEQIEPYFKQDSLISKLSPGETGLLQFSLLSDSISYSMDSVIPQSPRIPIIDFVFTRKKDNAHVIISTSDYTWRIAHDGKLYELSMYHGRDLTRFFNHYINKIK